MSEYHETVLLNEAIEGLNIQPDGIYADVTFGGGGHTKAILEQLSTKGRLFAFDQDKDARANIIKDDRLIFIPENFRHIRKFLRLHGIKQLQGIIADLGVSWHQINTPKRGFSTRFDEHLLDMRMNENIPLTARSIVNQYTSATLLTIFKNYGELPNSAPLAKAISKARQLRPIETVEQLKTIAEPFVRGKKHKYYAQLFQALRIEVNDEMGALKDLLKQSALLLSPEGRLVVIAYHSIEDRLVKNYVKRGSFDGIEEKDIFGHSHKPFKAINKKVIVPSTEEIYRNPKSRSAKMRIAEKN